MSEFFSTRQIYILGCRAAPSKPSGALPYALAKRAVGDQLFLHSNYEKGTGIASPCQGKA